MEKLIINAKREGYATNQVGETLTVGELIELLSDYDENTPVYIGNDLRGDYWYTYGSINMNDVIETCNYEEQ